MDQWLGSLNSGILFTKYNCKVILLISLFFIISGLIVFPLANGNKIVMGIARFISGFFQVFLVVYFPVWIDSFGEEKKTIWLTFINLAVVLGLVIGYIITAMFNIANLTHKAVTWRFSFYFQALCLTVSWIVFYYTDERDLNTNGILLNDDENNKDIPNFENMPVLRLSFFSNNPSLLMNKNYDINTMEEISDINSEMPDSFRSNEHQEPLMTSERLAEEERRKFQTEIPSNLTIAGSLKIILKKRLFIVAMLALSALFFIITAIQFWISDYMILVLRVPKEKVFLYFVVISITGPTCGLLIGGKISESLGGYTGKHAILFCLVNSILAVLFGFPIPFVNNPMVFSGLIWMELFFGAAMLPTLTGLMISSIPQKLRNLGNSVAQFVFNLLGYIPAPILYSYVNSLDKSKLRRERE